MRTNTQFNYHGTWYRITDISGNHVTTIEDPDLNKYPNKTGFTYWNVDQIKTIMGDLK